MNKEKKEIIINTLFSQSAISKMRKYNSFDKKAIQLYSFTEFQSDGNIITIMSFILKSFLNNNNSIMFQFTKRKNKDFISYASMNSQY